MFSDHSPDCKPFISRSKVNKSAATNYDSNDLALIVSLHVSTCHRSGKKLSYDTISPLLSSYVSGSFQIGKPKTQRIKRKAVLLAFGDPQLQGPRLHQVSEAIRDRGHKVNFLSSPKKKFGNTFKIQKLLNMSRL